MTYCRIQNILVLVDGIFPSPEPHTLENSKHTRLLPRCDSALKLFALHQFALNSEDGLFHSAGLDLATWYRGETGQGPFTDAVGSIDACGVCGFDEVLADNVDDALAALDKVLERVFGVVNAAGMADDENWRVVVYHLGVRVWREVGAGACR